MMTLPLAVWGRQLDKMADFWIWPIVNAFMFAGLLVGVLVFAFWIWMIVDCARRKFRNDLEKIIWILAIVFATWVGALVYFLVVRVSNPKGLSRR